MVLNESSLTQTNSFMRWFTVFSCAARPTLRKLRAEDMFETWVGEDFLQGAWKQLLKMRSFLYLHVIPGGWHWGHPHCGFCRGGGPRYMHAAVDAAVDKHQNYSSWRREQGSCPHVVCDVASRWFWVLRDPEAGCQRQHAPPWAEHRLDWSRWLSPGETSALSSTGTSGGGWTNIWLLGCRPEMNFSFCWLIPADPLLGEDL